MKDVFSGTRVKFVTWSGRSLVEGIPLRSGESDGVAVWAGVLLTESVLGS